MLYPGLRAALVASALAGVIAPLGAQSPATRAPAGTGAPSIAVSSPSQPFLAGDIEIRLPSVSIAGPPRSYQVVSIPVPAALTGSSDVRIEITPIGEFVILGPRTRRLNPGASGNPHVGVTIGIPASALAGRLIAAEARFYSAGSATLVVPVEVDVSLVRRVVLHPSTAPINGQAGTDVMLPFRIVNSGNVKETVSAELALPSGWASREMRARAIAISPGETVKRRVRLTIPALSPTGSFFVRIDLREGGETLGSETIKVEVSNSSSIGRAAGPLVTTAISHAVDENGRANRLFSVTAVGSLYDSVKIDAHISQGSAVGGAASNAFARLGSFQSSAAVTLSAPLGQLSMGNMGASFSDLTGLYSYGQGALLHLQHPGWDILGLGALSMPPVGSTGRKPMIGLRAERLFGVARLSTSVSHLADAGPSPRRLDAFGVGAAVPSLFGSTLNAEVAERRFQGESGIGWSSELTRTGRESNEQLRVAHAPGGSDAFARATDEMVASVSERLSSRASVSAGGWRTSDATSVFSGLKSNGFSVRPQYAIYEAVTVAIEARSYSFDATSRPGGSSAGGGFGSREQQLGISFSAVVRQYYLNTAAFLGNVTRTVSPVAQSLVTDRTPRNYWTTNAGWSGPGGIIEIQSRIEQTRDRGGFVNQQNMLGIRADQVVLPRLDGVRAEGELQRVSGFGGENSSIMRAGLAIPLADGFAFKIDAERNSIFRSSGGRVPWIFGARIEHSLPMRMLRTPGASGYVYEDLNANRHRDPGEPGVPGAIVRRGGETAVTDAGGRYRVGGDARQPIFVDEASLPGGWSPTGPGRGDLPVLLYTSAEVELVVAPRSGLSPVEVDLSKAHVFARDSAGREWSATMTGPTTATFQSLPLGIYRLDFDLSELSEPLVPRAPVAPLIVTRKDTKSITVTLDPRPIRMRNGNGPSGSGGAKKNDAPSADKAASGPAKPSNQ